MNFHVVALPHTQTTKDYNSCAYTQKVRKFCNMMYDLGHTVYLYAGEENEARCTELVTCITKDEQSLITSPEFDASLPHWQIMNNRAIQQITARMTQGDSLCLIAGRCQQPIAEAFPTMLDVEYGIGYGGVFANYKVFESYAWMHMVYAQHSMDAHSVDGKFFDAVIPNYFEVDDFEFREKKDDYFLYLGRCIGRKGVEIASQLCQRLGERLIIAGEGPDVPSYGEHVGYVGTAERSELLSGAKALLAPTLYVEPFGGVAIEAMICGTPVISTDWGAFTETNIHGVTGFRARSFAEFIDATERVDELDPRKIRDYAVNNYSTEVIAPLYEAYFDQLSTLSWDGWYDLKRPSMDRYSRYIP